MLALNRSLLNREQTRIIVLKALASIIFMCNLHVIFLSKIAPRYVILFTNGISLPFNVNEAQAVDDCEGSRSPVSYLH
jgi:hypothetical protein